MATQTLSCSLALIPELLAEVVRWLPSPLDIASLDCTSRLFHLGAPRSPVEEGLRLRAAAVGRAVEAALPAGETSWTQWLLWEERRLLLACTPVVASCAFHSVFVDAGGQLLTCGRDPSMIPGIVPGGADPSEVPSLLGQEAEGVNESLVPRVVVGLGGVRIRTVAAGEFHSLACSDEGVTYSFGFGSDGQLGHGVYLFEPTPRAIAALQGVHISAVAAGAAFSLALSRTGALYSFGEGIWGALGHGDWNNQHTPLLVAALQGVRVVAVAANAMASLALGEAGEVYSFGYSFYLFPEENQHTPLAIPELQGVRVCAMATGGEHSLVVSREGRLYSFGMPRSRLALGHGEDIGYTPDIQPLYQPMPRLVTALQGVRVLAVAAGHDHSLALSDTGEVYSFGGVALRWELTVYGGFPELGRVCETNLTPVVIPGLQGVHSISAGDRTSFAVTNAGVVYGWGIGVDIDGMPIPVLGLELMDNQCVPREYQGLQCLIHAHLS